MHHGIIVMWKISIISLVSMLCLVYGAFVYSSPSKTYWENVGPSWNRMLNPDTYND